MRTIKRIGIAIFIILFLSAAICYGQNIVKECYTKGVELAILGKFKEAKEEFEKALKVDPNDGSVKRALSIIEDALDQKIEISTAVHLFKGIDYDIKKLWDESIEELNKAVEFNPKYVHTYIIRGNAYYDKDQFHEAISDYNKVIELNPDDAGTYINRGYAYANKGQFDEAISDYSKAIELNPDDADTYNSRGIAYVYKDQLDDAITDYSKAIEINSKYVSYFLRGIAYADKGQDDNAITDYSKAIEINPNNADAYYNRGGIYYDLRKYKQAIEDYDQVIRLDPENNMAQIKRDAAHRMVECRAIDREEQAFWWLWQICFAIAFFSGVLKGRKVFGFILGIAGPLGAIVVLCTPSAIKRCIACKNTIPKKTIKCPHCQTDQPEKLVIKKELPVKIKVIKWLLLLVPILLWLLSVGSCVYKHHRVGQLMKEAEGLVWGNNSAQLIVHVQKKRIGEKDHYRIQVVKPDGKIAHESEMVIDNDMWGGGFVKAINADDDAELEVVVWGAHEARESYYLDYVEGIVQQKPFSHAITETKDLATEWHNAQNAELVTFFLFFPLSVYYILFGLVSLVIWLWRRRRSKAYI